MGARNDYFVIPPRMNLAVVAFFLHSVLATVLLGSKFSSRKDTVLKYFGYALLLNAAAFAVWSVAVITRPENLQDYVSVGTVIFIVGLLALLAAGITHLSAGNRMTVLVVAALVGAAIFYLGRMPANPSLAGFSPDGLFFFNVHPLLQALYVIVLSVTAFPAIEAVARKFRGIYSLMIRYGFTAGVAGGAVLITTTTANSSIEGVTLIGWVIGIAYFVLWTTFVFGKKAWEGVA